MTRSDVHLDATHLGKTTLSSKLPDITGFCNTYLGIDPAETPIPVLPTAHYAMGGIPTDTNGCVLADAGGTVFLSTHTLEVAEALCDRIAIMHRGRILDTGTLEELRHRHEQSDFEELFFGLLSQHEQVEEHSWDRESDSDLSVTTAGGGSQ